MSSKPSRTPLRLLAVLALLVALSILAALGTWQSARFLEKRDLFAVMEARLPMPRVELKSSTQLTPELDFRQIRLAGGKLEGEHTVVVERRFHHNLAGHWLLTPYRFADQTAVWVHTGWIPEDQPQLEAALPKNLEGFVFTPDDEYPDELAREQGTAFALEGKPRMGDLDADFLYERLGTTPPRPSTIVVLTTADGPNTFPRPSHDHITNPYLTPTTHFGYAVLWYGSGLLLIWLFWAGWTGKLDPHRKD